MLQRGFTLIEVMVVVMVAAILFGIAAPSIRSMIDSAKVKGAAESVLSGLRYARSEAINRNAPMRFQLVTALDATCVTSTTSLLWVVSQSDQANYGPPTGACDSLPVLPPDPCAVGCVGVSGVYIAYKSNGTTGTDPTIVVAADNPVVTFGPLGQVLSNMEGSASMQRVSVTSTDAGATPWWVRVAAGSGSLKLCAGLFPTCP